MNVKDFRLILKELLAQAIRVDEWGVDSPANVEDPEKPPSIALDEPARIEIQDYNPATGNEFQTTVNYPLQIMFRLPSLYRYDELPRGDFEAKLQQACLFLQNALFCEYGHEFVNPNQIEVTANATIARQENKDWILLGKINASLPLRSERHDLSVAFPLFDP